MRRLAPLLAAVTACAASAPAGAAEGSLVSVRPADPSGSWVVDRIAPGKSARHEALLVNLTDAAQEVRIGAADAITTGDGVFTLAGEAERPAGLGAWIVPQATRVVLAPRERRRLPMTVAVPPGTPPGEYAGGLVAQPSAPAGERTSGGVVVRVVERIGLRVYVTVPGRRDGSVRVEDVRATPAGTGGARAALGLATRMTVRFRAVHTGNVRYNRLHAHVELREGGRARAGVPVDLGTLLPGGVRDASAELPLPRWSPGDYEVVVRVGSVPEARAGVSAEVGAGRLYAAGGLVAGLVGLGGVGLLRRNRNAA